MHILVNKTYRLPGCIKYLHSVYIVVSKSGLELTTHRLNMIHRLNMKKAVKLSNIVQSHY